MADTRLVTESAATVSPLGARTPVATASVVLSEPDRNRVVLARDWVSSVSDIDRVTEVIELPTTTAPSSVTLPDELTADTVRLPLSPTEAHVTPNDVLRARAVTDPIELTLAAVIPALVRIDAKLRFLTAPNGFVSTSSHTHTQHTLSPHTPSASRSEQGHTSW